MDYDLDNRWNWFSRSTSYFKVLNNEIKNSKAKGGAYLAASDENLIIAQENGLFFYLALKDLDPNKEQLSLKGMPSNIYSFVEYFDFYQSVYQIQYDHLHILLLLIKHFYLYLMPQLQLIFVLD